MRLFSGNLLRGILPRSPKTTTTVPVSGSIAALFAGGTNGFWYDISDTSTLFQDTAGTIPVTASGQAVALVKDKSGNNYHLAQTSAALRPIYSIDGNGNPNLTFITTKYLVTQAASPLSLNAHSGMTVMGETSRNTARNVRFMSITSGSFDYASSTAICVWRATVGTDHMAIQTNNSKVAIVADAGPTPLAVWQWTARPSERKIYKNGTNLITSTAASSLGTTTGRIGIGVELTGATPTYANSSFNGNWYGAVFLGRDTSDVELAVINTYGQTLFS